MVMFVMLAAMYNWIIQLDVCCRTTSSSSSSPPAMRQTNINFAYLHFGTSVHPFDYFISQSIIELGASVTLEWHSNMRDAILTCASSYHRLPITYRIAFFVQRNIPYFNHLLTCNENEEENKWIITDVCISSDKFYRIEGDRKWERETHLSWRRTKKGSRWLQIRI